MRLKNLLFAGLAGSALSLAPMTKAQTLWTGPTTTFTQFDPNPDDFLTPSVSVTRGGNFVLFNDTAVDTAPPDTMLWAENPSGDINNYAALNYQPMENYRNGNLAGVLFANHWVLQLVNEQIYIEVDFLAWGQHGAGGFSYTRTTAPPPPPTPTVNITTPTNNSVFTAPATFSITASATVSSGTVTNVQFFQGTNSLRSVTNSPFTITVSNLVSGSYAFKAVATAAGVSATSTVVNVTVNPAVGTVVLTSPQVTNGVFSFNYNTASGLTYVVQRAPALSAWQPVATNIGSGGLIHFTDAVTGGNNFYRVDQVSGP
jgi:hypothetical protein